MNVNGAPDKCGIVGAGSCGWDWFRAEEVVILGRDWSVNDDGGESGGTRAAVGF